jgi:hypothetical protein
MGILDDVDIDAVIQRAVRKFMHYHSEEEARQDERYIEFLSHALWHRDKLKATLEWLYELTKSDKPVILLAPGRSGRFLAWLKLEMDKELKKKGIKVPRGWPAVLSFPIRPREMFFNAGPNHRAVPMGAGAAAEFIYDNVGNKRLYRNVFDAARRGEVQLVYIDPYEHKGTTRKTYQAVLERFGVDPRSLKVVILSRSEDPRVHWVGSHLLDSASHVLGWMDTKKESAQWMGGPITYERYVPRKHE